MQSFASAVGSDREVQSLYRVNKLILRGHSKSSKGDLFIILCLHHLECHLNLMLLAQECLEHCLLCVINLVLLLCFKGGRERCIHISC